MDVATLGIRVTQDGVAQAAQSLNTMAAAGEKADASARKLGATTQGLTRFQQDLVNRSREVYQAAELLDVQNKNAVRQWEKQRDMWAEIAARHKQTAVVENELAAATQLVMKNQAGATEYARRLAQAQEELSKVNGRVGPGINSLRSALTSMTASMLGTAPGVGQLTGVMGSLALGSTLMVGVLAGVAAVAFAYHAFTDDARKAKEEQDRLSNSLLDWYRTIQSGGDGARQIEAMRAKIVELRAELDKLKSDNPLTAAGAVGGENKIAAWVRILTAGSLTGMLAQFNTEYAKTVVATSKTLDDATKAVQAKQAAEAAALQSSQLQLDRQRALNDAFGKGAVALARINAEYDYREAKLQNDAQYAPAIAAAHNAIAKGMRDEAIRAAELTEAQREAEELQKSQAKTLDELRASLAKTNAEWTINAKQYERIIALNAMLNEAHEKDIPKIAAESNKIVAEQDKKSAEMLKKLKDFNNDMQRIWRDGIGKIATDGTKSFQDFFEDVFQMFSKLMDRMKQEGKNGGLLDGLKAIWNTPFSAAGGIAAGAAGASAGYASGSAGGGILSGALAGGLTAGPWGAVVGGLAGAAGGLLGAAHAHAEAAKALREAADQIRNNIAQYVAGAQGDDVQSKLAAEQDRYEKLWHSLGDLFDKGGISMDEFLVQMKAVMDAHEVYTQKIEEEAHAAEVAAKFADFRAMQDLRLQALQLQGMNDEAFAYQQQLEMQDAVNAGRSEEYLATLQFVQALQKAAYEAKKANDAFFQMADAAYAATIAARTYAWQQFQQSIADPTNNPNDFSSALQKQTSLFVGVYQQQIDVAKSQLKVQQDAQKTAAQSAKDTQKALDSLTAFRASLNIGDLSVLSPLAQKNAAEQAMADLFRQAQLGDKTAASNFGGAAQTFLQLSRGYNASGAGFVADQANVQRMTDSLLTQYGVQASIDQQMLDSANSQVDLLTHQIDLAQQQVDGINRAAQGIQQLYDRMFGSASGSIASVWDNLTSAALAQAIGGTPAGITPGNPYATGPNGLPFGNTTPYGPATVAERFFYAFQQFLASQASSSQTASPSAVVDATEEQTDVLQEGFSELIDAVNRVETATEENARQIRQLAQRVAS